MIKKIVCSLTIIIFCAITFVGCMEIVIGGDGVEKFYFPQPSGPHAVGTKLYQWTTDRPDTYAEYDSALRVLMAQVWYPAQDV